MIGSSSFCDLTSCLPEQDIHAIRGLSPTEIQQWALARAVAYEEYIRALRSVYNAATPIHRRLPVEVLVYIFGSVDSRNLRVLKLMHVCRLWRAILLKTSKFWAKLSTLVGVWEHPDALQAVLKYSGHRTITAEHVPAESILSSSLKPHLGRISSLQVTVRNNQFRKLHQLLGTGHFRSLESLRLVAVDLAASSTAVYDERTRLCTDANLRRLRRLELSVRFVDHRLVVSSVESLSVLSGDSTYTSSPPEFISSPEAILRTLERCSPSLEVLTIASALPPTGWDAVAAHPPCHLPRLRELRIEGRSTHPAGALLGAITFPPSASLSFTGIRQCEGSVLRHLVPAHVLPDGISAADTLSLQFVLRERSTLRTTHGGRELLRLQLPHHQHVVEDVRHMFSGNRTVVALEFCRSRGVPMDPEEILRLLAAFPRAIRLTVMDLHAQYVDKAEDTLLDGLAALSPSSGGVACPALEELILKGLDSDIMAGVVGRLGFVLDRRFSVLGRPLGSLVVILPIFTLSSFEKSRDEVSEYREALAARLGGLVDEIAVKREPFSRRMS
ncbi:hypothetical protein C8Q78DRAFT_1080541 [Trametes maxima]|nr:hypothetical protein C8Q78DRAFT_1080541 [Trametes maxima]